MKIILRIPARLADDIRADLRRAHPFAFERVGFCRCRYVVTLPPMVIGLVHDYEPVADADYIEDPAFGALVGPNAFRRAMQIAYSDAVGILHVHLHAHSRVPAPSGVDRRETAAFVPDFFHVRPTLPHGALILSNDSASARLWMPFDHQPHEVDKVVCVGLSLRVVANPRSAA